MGIGPDSVTVRTVGQPPLRASRVIFAVGGRPRLPPGRLAGRRLLLHSDQVLRPDGYRRVLARLTSVPPRVTIIGGSHSAFAVAGLLLRAPVRWSPRAITVAHRSPVRVTYPDRAAAWADGVRAEADQVCPATGVVHRFGGLRADAADLYRRVRDGGERRVHLVPVPDTAQWPAAWAGDADVVVAATGYESAAFGLLGGAAGAWDAAGRLRTAAGDLVPHAFGLGLGTQRRRGPGTGGEPGLPGRYRRCVVLPERGRAGVAVACPQHRAVTGASAGGSCRYEARAARQR